MMVVFAVKTMLNKKDFKEKSYNRCLYCDHRGVNCNGPRTSAMTLERWREFMRDMKEIEGLTYAEISARTSPPIAARTIEKKLSPGGDGQDLMRETARAIESAIIGSTEHPCYLASVIASSDSKSVTSSLEAEIARLTAEIAAVKEEAQKKIDHLLTENERKNRIIDKLLDK